MTTECLMLGLQGPFSAQGLMRLARGLNDEDRWANATGHFRSSDPASKARSGLTSGARQFTVLLLTTAHSRQ